MPKAAKRPTPDIVVSNHLSIILLRPETQAGTDWLSDNCDGALWFGGALACEPRYVDAVIDGATGDGLIVA